MTNPSPPKFVSRAGLKLHHALTEFKINPAGWLCADFGCNVGGFTDCLLQHNAAKVFAIDTGYGVLDYRLRINPRVVVMERTNALHINPLPLGDDARGFARAGEGRSQNKPESHPVLELVDLITIDLAWTRQHHSIPAALKWLSPPLPLEGEGRGEGLSHSIHTSGDRPHIPASSRQPTASASPPLIISLIKPHYEILDSEKPLLNHGFLPHEHAHTVFQRVLEIFPSLGVTPLAHTQSPLTGGKTSRKKNLPGNIEFLVLLKPR